MIALLQRVTSARVQVDGLDIAAIEQGLLVFLGVEKNDTQQLADRLLNKILSYRVFEDQQGKMNLSLTEVRGGLLLVPQFTLAANTERGLRPSFSSAAPPEQGEKWFDYMVQQAISLHSRVEKGKFAADMKVSLINDGPVTFWLQV